MNQPNRTSQGGIPPFLPGVILIGTFAFMMVILAPRPNPVDSSASQRTPTAITVLPTSTLSIPATPVPTTPEAVAPTSAPTNILTAIAVGASVDQPTAAATSTPGNVLTAIAVGAGPQAVTTVPTQSAGVETTPVLPAASLSPTPSAAVPTEVAAVPPAETGAAVVSADPALAAEGSMLFQSSCAACHSYDAHGIPGLGKDLVTSEFVHGMSDADLLHFITVGREATDPLNTTGVIMPARGGNAALTDGQLLAIIAYLRSIATG